jgi:hypothetical protein
MSYILREYLCEEGHRTESLETRGEEAEVVRCGECGGDAPRTVSAPAVKTVEWGGIQRGKAQERPPWALDTRPLADGMSEAEWKKKTRKQSFDERYTRVKQLLA